MRISRLYCPPPLEPGATIELDDRAARYLRQVLRLRPGDPVRLFDGSGADVTAELVRCDRKACSARVIARLDTEPEVPLHIHLGVGVSRGERMDFAIQKSVELGVSEITPLVAARSVVQLDPERRDKRMTHWGRVLLGACEQSGRSRLPVLHPPIGVADWLTGRQGGITLDHRAESGLSGLPHPGNVLNLLIGPEGGLDRSERNQAAAADFTAVRLGPRVLRTETAPLAALTAIQVLWGDLH